MNEEWTIRSLHGDNNIISTVEFQVKLTHDDYPGAADYTGGIVGIDPGLDGATATVQQIADAVKSSMGASWVEMMDFHLQQIAFEYDRITGDVISAERFAPPPTNADVNRERDRRIAAGSTFTVTGYGDVPITGRERDMIFLDGLKARAKELQTDAPVMEFRDALNVNHFLTPDQIVELVDKGFAWIQQVMKVSWDMKDNGIPEDFQDDIHWP